jgi:inorganic pyrophosphatase/exopolyphosphatase
VKIITSGTPYIDIDAYAGGIAYAELQSILGFDAIAVSSSTLNESITEETRSWDVEFSSRYTPSTEDTFTLIDVSDPSHFDPIVDLNRVEAVIDHHPGYEEFWNSRVGTDAHIEFIGAACTQVCELWEHAGLLDNMSQNSARLLVCGILDNTLNFSASVSTDRDVAAYKKLLPIAKLPENWVEKYFSDCSTAITKDFSSALGNDTKKLQFLTYERETAVGQIVVWDASKIIDDYSEQIEKVLGALRPDWFINIVSVSEGKSRFYAKNDSVKQWLAQLLTISFEGDIAEANRLWLRKEILKQDIDAHQE